MPEDRLDQILNEMRAEAVSAEEMSAVQERVWQRLAGANPVACSEFRPLLPEYLAGNLPEARRMLVEDHLSRCTDCRRAFAELKGERKVVSMSVKRRVALPVWTKWAVAAGLAVTALFLSRGRIDMAMAPGGARATVQAVRGNLYRVSGGVLNQGAALGEAELVRTAAGAHAVLRLADGSLVEVNERTQLAVTAAWSGQTIQLDRGDVIVQAAKQRRGHLQVVTRDSIASVKGTVFAVSSGAAGSIVSVMEGSVAVTQPGSQRLLTRGEHSSSTQALADVPVRQTVAWSQDAEKYYNLLGDLMVIEKQLAATADKSVRTQAKLLPYLPANPILYAAIPNLGVTIRQAMTLVEQRTSESPALKEWWDSAQGKGLQEVVGRLQTITPALGDEIVFVLIPDPAKAADKIPLMLAEVQPGQQDALRQALDNLPKPGEPAIPYRVTDKLVLISDSAAHVASMQAQLGRGASGEFAAEIVRHYEHGTAWLIGIDAASFGGMAKTGLEGKAADASGFSGVKHIFFEQRAAQGVDENSATLTFAGARTGISSWLAAPGSAGSADYVSSGAMFVLSASTKSPRQALDEMLSLAGKSSPGFGEGMQQMQAETGIDPVAILPRHWGRTSP